MSRIICEIHKLLLANFVVVIAHFWKFQIVASSEQTERKELEHYRVCARLILHWKQIVYRSKTNNCLKKKKSCEKKCQYILCEWHLLRKYPQFNIIIIIIIVITFIKTVPMKQIKSIFGVGVCCCCCNRDSSSFGVAIPSSGCCCCFCCFDLYWKYYTNIFCGKNTKSTVSADTVVVACIYLTHPKLST